MLPKALLTVSETLYVPTSANVWTGFCRVAFSPLPSPKSHAYVRGGSPVELSVNVTVKGAGPVVVSAENAASGAAPLHVPLVYVISIKGGLGELSEVL